MFVDKRLLGFCVFCGASPDTRDHVPSKVFLDDPLPNNLPVVGACATCNQGFSLDEEYLACFLEVVIHGYVDPHKLTREKIKRSLNCNQKLADRLKTSLSVDENGKKIWTPETDRVSNVILKLARGHAAYELASPKFEKPEYIQFQPFLNMSEEERHSFENAGEGEIRLWPEIGSRAFLRAIGESPYSKTTGSWIEIQSGRYRYSVYEPDGEVVVRIVLYEYLACQVGW